MSWTAFKKRMRGGSELQLTNYRQPWRTRRVRIVSRSKRSVVIQDVNGDGVARLPLPAAAFTRSVDDNTFELLAEEDGPRWDADHQPVSVGLPAGMPYCSIEVVKEA